jgi:NitT/TauT family transport system permease protein
LRGVFEGKRGIGDRQGGAVRKVLLPLIGVSILVAVWAIAIWLHPSSLLPGPRKVLLGIIELARRGLLVKHLVASLFRVTWGYVGAVLLGVPIGLSLGWWRAAGHAINPFLQILRPISPLAWIPLSILWFGVGDRGAIFIIFLASVLPITVSTMNAVALVPAVHVRAARNFGLSARELLAHVVFPSVLPQVIIGMRLALGVAWLVVVAAEMIAVNSGLGFLIVDARNAGNRYDLVVAGIVLIGAIGVCLDLGMRSFERSARVNA